MKYSKGNIGGRLSEVQHLGAPSASVCGDQQEGPKYKARVTNKMESEEDYTSEDSRNKRRRETEDQETLFKKSKKMNRSPQKEIAAEGKLIDMMKELMKDVKEIKHNQESYQMELGKLKKDNEILKKEKEEIKRKMKLMESRMNTMEKRNTRKNIVISGLRMTSEGGADLRMGMESFIKNKLDVDVIIREAEKIGETVYKIELNNTEEKDNVMQTKHKLRQLKDKIYINNEMTQMEREIQKKLKQIAENERREGKTVKMRHQKIIIQGKEYGWDREEEKLLEWEKIHPNRSPKN